jgi:transposase
MPAPKKKPTPKRKTKAASEGVAPAVVAEVATEAKHAGGRPTKYKPEYCEAVIGYGRLGKSREWIAAELMVIPETLTNWGKEHPEFFDAITLAKQLELKWWEDAGQDNLTESGFSSSAWSRSMAARFPQKWREKSQVDHGVSNELAALLGQIDGDGSSLV